MKSSSRSVLISSSTTDCLVSHAEIQQEVHGGVQDTREMNCKDSMGLEVKDAEVAQGKVDAVELGQKADWRSLFAASSDQSMSYFPPQKIEGKVVVSPPKDVFEEGESQWRNSVVAQFIGQIPNFSLFQRLVNMLWGKEGELEIRSAGHNLFIIQFSNPSMRDKVLEGGPWHIHNKPLIVRKWEPGLSSLEFNMSRIPLWIHLGKVPLELFTQKGLSYIASAVGSPLYMDRITASQQRLAFAKVCVEVEASMDIPRSIEVEMKDGSKISVNVEVPWFPPRCTHCSVFGHVGKSCPAKPVTTTAKVWVPKPVVVADSASIRKEKEVMVQDVVVESIQVDTPKPQERMKDIGTPSTNRFAILEVAEQNELNKDEGKANIDETVVDEEVSGPKKTRAAAAGVAELMKTLKPKKKGPIDKGRKVQIGCNASRGQPSTPSS